MDNTHYVYKPIQPYQTRLIRLYRSRGALDAPLVCSLETADLLHSIVEGLGLHSATGDQAVEYNALSYTWGSEEKSEVITCSGAKLQIGANLSLALRRLREYEDDDQYLWVDAICINQSDKDEVSEQVARMLVIYQKAARVIAWIDSTGEEPPQELGDVLRAAQACEQQLADKSSLNFWKASAVLNYIYTRDWFRRVWVQQEVFAARKLQLQSGPYRFVWSKLLAEPICLGTMAEVTQPLDDVACAPLYCSASAKVETTVTAVIEELKQQHHSGPECFQSFLGTNTPPDLAWTLFKTHNLGATNPQDRIFGVLGISEIPTKAMSIERWISARQASIFVPIDYTAEMSAILTTVTWAILMQHSTRMHKTIEFFPHCLAVVADYKIVACDVDLGTCQSLLPSWVVDWRLAGPICYDPHDEQNVRMIGHPFPEIGKQLRIDNMAGALPHNKLVLRGVVDDRFTFSGNYVWSSKRLSVPSYRRIWTERGDKAVWKLNFETEPHDLIVFLVALHHRRAGFQTLNEGGTGVWILRPCQEDTYKLMAFLAWYPHKQIGRVPDGHRRLRVDRVETGYERHEFTLPVGLSKLLDGRKFTIV
jgi:hypothetical protein